MDDVPVVDRGDGIGEARCQPEEPSHVHRSGDEVIEGGGAEVLHDEGGHSLVRVERQRFDDRGRIDESTDLVFVFELFEVLGAAPPGIEHLEDDRALICIPDSAIDDRQAAAGKRLSDGIRIYGGHTARDARARTIAPVNERTTRDAVLSYAERPPHATESLVLPSLFLVALAVAA
jgi:hypothetical protein